MSVSKDSKRGTYYVQCRYKDGTGESKKKTKRGFKTDKEAPIGKASSLYSIAFSCGYVALLIVRNVRALAKFSLLKGVPVNGVKEIKAVTGYSNQLS